jgi:hypothetical protein
MIPVIPENIYKKNLPNSQKKWFAGYLSFGAFFPNNFFISKSA